MRFLCWIFVALPLAMATPVALPSDNAPGMLNIGPRAQNAVTDISDNPIDSVENLCSENEQANECGGDQALGRREINNRENSAGEHDGGLESNLRRGSLLPRQSKGNLLSGALIDGLPLLGSGGQ
ncbi:hypothetical protein TESG_07773 [Trichophyton tonsurans CBS 112818]|uniref:Uncharacterized protein n=1 Tax=Trichophyton tonsurans (strain CBS 112818) TaxID=647933 RepID=F2SA29_TRIT1|nr:hypothetical protein TESG_07773 [Trichophyton tonsurans CBS 112818]